MFVPSPITYMKDPHRSPGIVRIPSIHPPHLHRHLPILANQEQRLTMMYRFSRMKEERGKHWSGLRVNERKRGMIPTGVSLYALFWILDFFVLRWKWDFDLGLLTQ